MSQNAAAAGAGARIRSALLELMKQNYYRDISVSEIARTAGVSRQAFYLCFSGKDEILRTQFRDFFNSIVEDVKALNIRTVEQLVRLYTSIVESNMEHLKLLAVNNLGGMLGDVLVESFANMPPVLPTQRLSQDDRESRYINSFWIHAFIQVYTLWINEGMQTSPAEISRMLTDIMKGNYFTEI